MNLRIATRDSLVAALTLFEQAVALDPTYASAWAHIGLTYSLQGQFLTLPALLVKATEALERALEHRSRRTCSRWPAWPACGWPKDAATRRSGLRPVPSISTPPTSPPATRWPGRSGWGRACSTKGIAALERARAHNPDAGYVFQQLALLRAIKGELGTAEIEAERAVALQEGFKSGTEGLFMVGSHVRLGYVRYRQGRYDGALASFAREQAFLAEHDHALKGRLQIEILQKQGAAYWRKGDREASDRAFAEMLKAFRARQSRGADDPFTKYYVASMSRPARRGRRGAALPGRVRAGAAGADPRPRPARPGFRGSAGGSGLPIALVDGDAVVAPARIVKTPAP